MDDAEFVNLVDAGEQAGEQFTKLVARVGARALVEVLAGAAAVDVLALEVGVVAPVEAEVTRRAEADDVGMLSVLERADLAIPEVWRQTLEVDHLDGVLVVAARHPESGTEGPMTELLDLIERSQAVAQDLRIERHVGTLLGGPDRPLGALRAHAPCAIGPSEDLDRARLLWIAESSATVSPAIRTSGGRAGSGSVAGHPQHRAR